MSRVRPSQLSSGGAATDDALVWDGSAWVPSDLNATYPQVVAADAAFGNAATDATAHIQAKIDALPANGGTLYLPPGRYKITSTLDLSGKPGCRIVGAGNVSSFDGGQGLGSALYTGTAGMTLFSMDGGAGVYHYGPTLENLNLTDDAGGSTLLEFTAVNHVTLRNVGVRGAATGIRFDSNGLDSSYHDLFACNVYDCDVGIDFVAAGTASIFGGEVRLCGVGVRTDASCSSIQVIGSKVEPFAAGQVGIKFMGVQMHAIGCNFELNGDATTIGVVLDGAGAATDTTTSLVACGFTGANGTEKPYTISANVAGATLYSCRALNCGAPTESGYNTRIFDSRSGDTVKHDSATDRVTYKTQGGTTVVTETHDNLFTQRKLHQATAEFQEVLGDDSDSKWKVIDSTGALVFCVEAGGWIDFRKAGVTTSTPPAGAGGALPATPAGYLQVKVNGNAKKIPYYDF